MTTKLSNHQNIIDFVLQGRQKQHELTIKELSSLYKHHCSITCPENFGPTKASFKFISSDNEPVSVLNNTKAALTAAPTATCRFLPDIIHHRAGFINNLSTKYYQTLDEGYPLLINNAQQLRIVSTSICDISDSSGIKQVSLGGINERSERNSELLALNGTTPVITSNKYRQLDIITTVSTGPASATSGTILVTNSENTISYAAIAPGNNSWRSERFFTDYNTTGYICQWTVGSANSRSRLELRTRPVSRQLFNTLVVKALGIANNDSINFVFPIHVKIPPNGCAALGGQAKHHYNEIISSFELFVRLEPFHN